MPTREVGTHPWLCASLSQAPGESSSSFSSVRGCRAFPHGESQLRAPEIMREGVPQAGPAEAFLSGFPFAAGGLSYGPTRCRDAALRTGPGIVPALPARLHPSVIRFSRCVGNLLSRPTLKNT